MIYLIQDCYKNNKGEYIDILKIGYSDKPFMKSRNNQYRTHNFGYRFLGEIEGDIKFESYLHEKYKSLRLSEDTEWFLYDDSIVNEFFTVDDSEKDIILTKCQYISNIQEYLLRTITKPGDLYKKYKDLIVKELESGYGSIVKEEKDIICERIKDTFMFGYNTTINYIRENCTPSNKCFSDIPDLISKTWLDINPWKNRAELFFNLNAGEESQDAFDVHIKKKIETTKALLCAYEVVDNKSKQALAKNYKFVEKARKYKSDFVSVNEHAGSDLKPVFNNLVMISEMRAFDIQQKDYKDRFIVFTALFEEVGDIEDVDMELAEINNIPYLPEKYKYFCTLSEDMIHSLLPHLPESFTNYYTVLGVTRMKELRFNATDMRKEYEGIIGNQGINIRDHIISLFVIGETYPKSKIKEMLRDLYESLNYYKTPKAVDLEDYFVIKDRTVTNKETGKRDNCYYIEKVKEG